MREYRIIIRKAKNLTKSIQHLHHLMHDLHKDWVGVVEFRILQPGGISMKNKDNSQPENIFPPIEFPHRAVYVHPDGAKKMF